MLTDECITTPSAFSFAVSIMEHFIWGCVNTSDPFHVLFVVSLELPPPVGSPTAFDLPYVDLSPNSRGRNLSCDLRVAFPLTPHVQNGFFKWGEPEFVVSLWFFLNRSAWVPSLQHLFCAGHGGTGHRSFSSVQGETLVQGCPDWSRETKKETHPLQFTPF